MAIRAYRVVQILTVKTESFSFELPACWQDDTLEGFLDVQGHLHSLGDNFEGLTKIPVTELKKVLVEVNLSEETRKALETDIEFARCRGEDFIQYYCY